MQFGDEADNLTSDEISYITDLYQKNKPNPLSQLKLQADQYIFDRFFMELKD